MNKLPEDHRVIARRLDLLHFQEEAPGMVFWHPPGFTLLRVLEEASRAASSQEGYVEVRTPQVLRAPIWAQSGHWEHFQEGMFRVGDPAIPAALKPVSCPAHIGIVNRRSLSWRELPYRVAELGLVHRDEQQGALCGLLRLRQFTQDDGHIFCEPHQLVEEIRRFCASIGPFYAAFGFERVEVGLSTRPPARLGDDAGWDLAEAALAEGAALAGLKPVIQPGEGAFYGPKLEFVLIDEAGRRWQCGTMQVDLVMPERFDVEYVGRDGQRRRPVMLHRARYGSLERFMGLLLEHHQGRLPGWLAPSQCWVLPIGEEHEPWAEHVRATLVAAGRRVALRSSEESLGRRIAEAHQQGVPAVLVIGGREVAARSVAWREPGGRSSPTPLQEAVERLNALCRCPLAP